MCKIILNNMFPKASYDDGNNIYHEVINLFLADNEKYYLYLNANGEYDGKEPVNVINVVRVCSGLYKVLSVAIGCKKGNDEIKNIKYNGISLDKYFENNHKLRNKVTYYTFECDKENVYVPKENIYIAFKKFGTTDSENNQIITNDKIIKLKDLEKFSSSCRICNITPTDKSSLLKDIINNITNIINITNITNHKIPCDKLQTMANTKLNFKEENYFSFLGVEKNELQYSNAIVKLLNFKKDGKMSFLNELFKESNINNSAVNNDFEVLREEKNIDILFRNLDPKDGKIVIIENKIDASLTLSDKGSDIKTQASKIFKDVFGKELNNNNTNASAIFNRILKGNENNPSQLSKYYLYAVAWALKAGWSDTKIEEDIICFFLCPEYYKEIYNKNFFNKYAFGNKYTLITYKNLLKVFDNKAKLCLSKNQLFIYEGFIDAISSLASDRDDLIERTMIKRFIDRHNAIKSSNPSSLNKSSKRIMQIQL